MTGLSFNTSNTSENKIIKNDGFFPDVSTQQIRESVRLDGSVSDPRLKDAITTAILEVNKQLRSLKDKASELSALATTEIDGRPDTELLYFRAVYSAVAADINEKYGNYDSTHEGQKKLSELEPTVNDHRRNLRWAIRDLLGVNRCTVDLI